MTIRKSLPSKEEIDIYLSYDSHTGYFYWKTKISGATGIGNIAGSLDKKSGYLRIQFGKTRYMAHVLAWIIMTGQEPPSTVDHKNRIRSDNKWTNLRLATPTEQARNTSIRNDNSWGKKGVYKRKNKWRAMIRVNKKLVHLGTFSSFEDALSIRTAAETYYFGEFNAKFS